MTRASGLSTYPSEPSHLEDDKRPYLRESQTLSTAFQSDTIYDSAMRSVIRDDSP